MRRFILFLCLAAMGRAAEPKWFRVTGVPIELVSDAPPKQALELLGVVEQFRSALGQTLGLPDLASHPPVRLLVRRTNGPPVALISGRDIYLIPLDPERPIPAIVFRDLTKLYLTGSIGRLPDGIARGLETFFSTIQVQGVHVTWGMPPSAPERTVDWARIHLLATQPEYYGKLKVFLYNLEKGVAYDAALRNAIGKDPKDFDAEVDAYLKRGVFTVSEAPNRPLNSQRDFTVRPMTAPDARLAVADLLDAHSQTEYEQMTREGPHAAEAWQGLALLAERRGDHKAAEDFYTKSIEAESKSASVWVAYAQFGPNRGESVARALDLDPSNPEAHYLAGLQRDDLTELKKAAELAPQVVRYQEALAQTYLGQKKFSEAGRAYRAAELAASDPAERDRLHQDWAGLTEKKFALEDADRQAQADALERLRQKALTDLHAAEARVNNGSPKLAAGEPIAQWDDVMPVHIEGALTQVDCLGKQTRIAIQPAGAPVVKLSLKSRRCLTCGPQRNVHAAVDYSKKPDAKLGTVGELESLPE